MLKRALLALFLACFTLACDLSVLPQLIGISSGGIIQRVTLAEAIRGTEKEPIGETTTFKPSSVLHAVIAIKDAPPNTKFGAAWYIVDVGAAAKPNTLIDQAELTSSGTRNLDFTLTPSSSWPPGTYKVEISLNGKLDRTLNFSVR